MIDVLISGYYGFNNSGDEAILDAMIKDLRKVNPNIKIAVLSKTPNETSLYYDVLSIDRFNIIEVISAMKESRLFISGGGSLIQDITSIRSLYYYLCLIKLAKIYSKKVMLYANGIGPIKKINEPITSIMINNADVITLREENSRCVLNELGVTKPKIYVTADPVFSLKPRYSNMFEGYKNLVGFSIREWGKLQIEVLAKVADFLIQEFDINLVFLPMHHPSDLEYSRKVISLMKNKPLLMEKKYKAEHLLGIIKRFELMIGMRLHSLIYAASVAVPQVGFIYDPKVEAFIKQTNQISAGDVKNMSFEKLKDILTKAWLNRSDYKNILINNLEGLKEKAFENTKIVYELLNEGI